MSEIDLGLYWDQFKNELLNYIKIKINNKSDAEDILQDVFIKIYKNYDQLSDHSKLKAWLYKVTKNAIIDYYRKQEVSTVPFETIENSYIYDEKPSNMNDEIITCLKLFLSELPDNYRLPLEMHELEGKKHSEISKELNISLSGSKTRVQRGREKLREILSTCCEVEFDAYGNVVEYTLLNNNISNCDK